MRKRQLSDTKSALRSCHRLFISRSTDFLTKGFSKPKTWWLWNVLKHNRSTWKTSCTGASHSQRSESRGILSGLGYVGSDCPLHFFSTCLVWMQHLAVHSLPISSYIRIFLRLATCENKWFRSSEQSDQNVFLVTNCDTSWSQHPGTHAPALPWETSLSFLGMRYESARVVSCLWQNPCWLPLLSLQSSADVSAEPH